MTFHKILCPIDFSPGSQYAMRVAVRIAAVADAELVLANVWYLPSVAYAGEVAMPSDAVELMVEDCERGLAQAAREASALGARRVTTTLLSGAPWDQLVAALRDDPAFDLVVMGTHGRSGLARVLLGSVTEQVVRHAPCPVLAVRERGEARSGEARSGEARSGEARGGEARSGEARSGEARSGEARSDEPGSFRHILCPVDFSDSARRAVELAGALAAPGGAGIALLHVIEMPVAYSGEPNIPGFADDLDRQAARALERWATELAARVSVPVTARSRIGRPGAQILAALDSDPSFDLVVMGSHGRTGLRRLLLGSVAEQVVRHAPCPVLVARSRTG